MGAKVSVEKEKGLAIVTINNPPLNVMDKDVIASLRDTFQQLSQDPETVVVILTGAGDKAFMAGADIKEFPQLMDHPNMKEPVMETHAVLNQIDFFEKPTIAVLNGLTFGGGCELALTFDIRIAEEHTQIGLPEIKLGLFPGGGGTQRLPRLIGEAKAKELMYTGEPIDAKTAQQIGLVNHVTKSGAGLEKAVQIAKQIRRHSLPALSCIKRAVDEGMDMSFPQAIEHEADLFTEVFQTEDIREGVSAFIEKRKPEFKHR
ncbi:enoyl-CoA hydratase [Alkalihalophilus pseudofirmus OF4]|uniref:Enoyl-CoA hydratase n=2 Tax=Alkalihalophilus pseudofirmus TaxID=79885 RepID=D3FY04_ALKPO|nr:enoyl-CoA hydratase [Alkalihalophilus pseudofirmus]ADC50763.1 enoyl-CoA hydratase [Alkalihalophilus pseudofirmus OF4]MDV2883961.1 enoyl-CoA hydratase [Alkalihalophilus pseudofirmus]